MEGLENSTFINSETIIQCIKNLNIIDIKADCWRAFYSCKDRGLNNSSKWLAELLYATKDLKGDNSPKIEVCLDEMYLLSKSYFDLKEYDRAAFFCKGYTSDLGKFLYFFSRYLSAEKKRIDNMTDVMVVNNSIKSLKMVELSESLQELHNKNELDGFCLYLYGIVLKKLNLTTEAIDILVKAINMEPLHWGAWLELATLIKDRTVLSSISLPSHWLQYFFLAHTYLELQMNMEASSIYESLAELGLHNSSYIKAQIGLAYHNMRDVDDAIETFEELKAIDPYRLDNMDTYSNLLYVKDMRVELSYLAHHVADIDKYRVETCCVIGNYYSLRGQHEKAVLYFQRALKLNPYYLSAWTLMGHEYMELKNTNAAIQSYRQAIEANRRDYRAWYGLGQTYEMIKMPFYCLYYYKQAQMLRPSDSRMLVALGQSYEKLERLQEAKKCYWKAYNVGDMESSALLHLGKLYEKLKEADNASSAYMGYLKDTEEMGVEDRDEQSMAHRFLAQYFLRKKELEKAFQHAHKCTEYNDAREEGKAILREISQRRLGCPPNEGVFETPRLAKSGPSILIRESLCLSDRTPETPDSLADSSAPGDSSSMMNLTPSP